MIATTDRTLDQAFTAMFHAAQQSQKDHYYPKTVTKQEFYDKIIAACTKIGIDDIVIREWGYNSIGSRFTNGGVRQKKYDKKNGQVSEDIAYLIDRSMHPKPSYHPNLVHIKYDNFSRKKGEEFRIALIQEGLNPQPYHPSCGPLFYTEEMIRWDLTKDTKALYR